MFRILAKTGVVGLISFVLLNVLSYAALKNVRINFFINPVPVGSEVYTAINLSKELYPDRKIIILGDSVAYQLFTCGLNDRVNAINLTCNQAISLAGHFILLTNALKQNQHVSKVYLLYHVGSFSNDLDQEWTYNYFVKPFYGTYHDYFSTKTRSKIDAGFLGNSYLLPITKVLPCFESTDYSVINKLQKNVSAMSPTSVEYLILIYKLCQQYKIVFKIISVPTSSKTLQEYSGLKRKLFEKKINECMLDTLFVDYFTSMLVLNGDFFKDGIHFKAEYVKPVSVLLADHVGLLTAESAQKHWQSK